MLGAMLNTMAVVDMTGLLDYAIKAVIGGFIWLGFKLFSDYLTGKINPPSTTTTATEGEKLPEEKFKPTSKDNLLKP